MADFCKQCAVDIFGEDAGDHAGHSTPADTSVGLYCTVICEGCGIVQVDHEGTCISPDCLVNHGTGGRTSKTPTGVVHSLLIRLTPND